MLQIVLNPDRVVEIPQIGTFVEYRGKEYEVVRTTTTQEQNTEIGQNPWNPTFTTICRLLEVTDEGDDAGNPPIEVEADLLTEI